MHKNLAEKARIREMALIKRLIESQRLIKQLSTAVMRLTQDQTEETYKLYLTLIKQAEEMEREGLQPEYED